MICEAPHPLHSHPFLLSALSLFINLNSWIHTVQSTVFSFSLYETFIYRSWQVPPILFFQVIVSYILPKLSNTELQISLFGVCPADETMSPFPQLLYCSIKCSSLGFHLSRFVITAKANVSGSILSNLMRHNIALVSVSSLSWLKYLNRQSMSLSVPILILDPWQLTCLIKSQTSKGLLINQSNIDWYEYNCKNVKKKLKLMFLGIKTQCREEKLDWGNSGATKSVNYNIIWVMGPTYSCILLFLFFLNMGKLC